MRSIQLYYKNNYVDSDTGLLLFPLVWMALYDGYVLGVKIKVLCGFSLNIVRYIKWIVDKIKSKT